MKYVEVQMQDGSGDCGLFTIAFATTLANGGQPGACSYNQAAMRFHLYSQMKNVLAPLGPIKQSRREAHEVKRTATVSIVSIHCMCRLPELKGCAMIA